MQQILYKNIVFKDFVNYEELEGIEFDDEKINENVELTE